MSAFFSKLTPTQQRALLVFVLALLTYASVRVPAAAPVFVALAGFLKSVLSVADSLPPHE